MATDQRPDQHDVDMLLGDLQRGERATAYLTAQAAQWVKRLATRPWTPAVRDTLDALGVVVPGSVGLTTRVQARLDDLEGRFYFPECYPAAATDDDATETRWLKWGRPGATAWCLTSTDDAAPRDPAPHPGAHHSWWRDQARHEPPKVGEFAFRVRDVGGRSIGGGIGGEQLIPVAFNDRRVVGGALPTLARRFVKIMRAFVDLCRAVIPHVARLHESPHPPRRRAHHPRRQPAADQERKPPVVHRNPGTPKTRSPAQGASFDHPGHSFSSLFPLPPTGTHEQHLRGRPL